MTDSYTQAVLRRAKTLHDAQRAASAFVFQRAPWLRAAIGAAAAALLAMVPAVSAAASLM